MTKSALTMTKSKAGIALIEGDESLETAAILGALSPLGITAMGTFPLRPIALGQIRPRHFSPCDLRKQGIPPKSSNRHRRSKLLRPH